MKTCTSCGANMPDEARFCTVCGNRFAAAQTPAAAPDIKPAPAAAVSDIKAAPVRVAPAVNKNTAANGALIRVCSSGLVLAVAIMLVVAIVLSVAGTAMLGSVNVKNVMNDIEDMIIDVADKDFDYIVTDEDFDIFFEETGLDEITEMSDSLAGSSAVGALVGNLFNILTFIALLIIYISARKGGLNSAGFVILKIVCIIDLIVNCICALCVFAGSIIGVSALSSFGSEFSVIKYLAAPAAGFAAFLWILMILPILLYSFLIKTLNSMKRIVKTGSYNGRISASGAILLIVMSASGFVWKILNLTLGISILPVSVLSTLSEILMVAAEVHAGMFILKAKYIVSENA